MLELTSVCHRNSTCLGQRELARASSFLNKQANKRSDGGLGKQGENGGGRGGGSTGQGRRGRHRKHDFGGIYCPACGPSCYRHGQHGGEAGVEERRARRRRRGGREGREAGRGPWQQETANQTPPKNTSGGGTQARPGAGLGTKSPAFPRKRRIAPPSPDARCPTPLPPTPAAPRRPPSPIPSGYPPPTRPRARVSDPRAENQISQNEPYGFGISVSPSSACPE